MNLSEAVNALEALVTTPEELEALATLNALAIERDEALRQAEAYNARLELIVEIITKAQQR